jgi:hypothetical protein
LNEEDSCLEESDEDIFEDEMSDENFKTLVVDMVKQITDSSYSVDCAMINLLQIKHAYSKDNFACTNVIYPSIFEFISTKITQDMKQTAKIQIFTDIVK